MKAVLAEREIEVGNVGEVAEFSIKANGKAFKVLIDGLYSDKALAVVRELCSNAIDSHAAAGQTLPFDLHLPTNFEPHFSVRDYGTSLEHTNVMKLYTTVFESSKEDDNTQVGKLGLGSKSPFAYTDTFTVTAWLDGAKRSYSAYIGPNYIPQIAFMGEELSDEPQGFEVSFPVKSKDITAFLAAATTFCAGLDALPNLTGNRNSNIKSLAERKALMSGNGWRLFDDYENAQARQGCVIYPIDGDAVYSKTSQSLPILRVPVVIDFPIGEVDIAASREGLSYDDTTCQNIVKRTRGIMDEIREKFFGQIKDCKTYFEARKAYRDLQASSAVPRAVKTAAEDKIFWRGRRVKSSINLRDLEERAFDTGDFAYMAVTQSHLTRSKTFRWDASSYAYHQIDDLVVFQDLDEPIKHVEKRLKHFFETERARGQTPPHILWIKSRAKSGTYRRFLAMTGKPTNIIDVKTLDLPPKMVNTAPRKKVSVKELRTNGAVDVAIDVTLGGLYVNMERGDVVLNGKTYSVFTIAKWANAARDSGLIDATTPVYGISKSISGVLKKSDKWVDAVEFMQAQGRALLLANPNAWAAIEAAAFVKAMESGWNCWDKLFCKLDPAKLNAGDMKTIVSHRRSLVATAAPAQSLHTVVELLEAIDNSEPAIVMLRSANGQTTEQAFTDSIKGLKKKYSMLKHMMDDKYSSINQDGANDVTAYVNLVDA